MAKWVSRRTCFCLTLLLVVAAGAGCLKREETVTVLPDGAVWLVTKASGDVDLNSGDARPTAESGWLTADLSETDDDGETQEAVLALRRVSARQPQPGSYAPPNSRAERISLRFPTTLTIERREDGTYYHWKRVYQGRNMAWINTYHKQYLQTDEMKDIMSRKPNELSEEERIKLAGALIDFEARKVAQFIESAAEMVSPPVPQDVWLRACRKAIEVYASPDLRERATAMLGGAEVEPGEEFEGLDQTAREEVTAAIRAAFVEAGRPEREAGRLIEGFALLRSEYEITADLQDEEWDVIVIMPGRIIAHNSVNQPGDASVVPEPLDDEGPVSTDLLAGWDRLMAETRNVDFEAGFQKVTWQFKGEDLQDRDLVLAVTSFVEREE